MDASGFVSRKDDTVVSSVGSTATTPSPGGEPAADEVNKRVDAIWGQMNKGLSKETLNSLVNKRRATIKKAPQKKTFNVLAYLGLAPKKTAPDLPEVQQKEPNVIQYDTSDEGKRLAAAALAAVKDAALAAAAASSRGKIEITEVRDFAGQEIEVKKLIDADSKEALEKAKGPQPSAVDAVLEQIKKKPKLSLLDKTKKDWGEFKEENREVEEELGAYKKSANQYLDKVSFLQRADYREFERERDVRLAMQARRKTDMREEL